MSATMAQIAEEADVSVALVSRLLRADPSLRISDERRRRIFRARDALGGLRMQRRRLTKAIVMPVDHRTTPQQIQTSLGEPLYLYPTFQQTLEEAGFHLQFPPIDYQQFCKALRQLIGPPRQCDGIVVSSNGMGEEVADILAKSRFPHVSNDYRAEQYDITTVNIHRTEGVRRALAHLKELGHRRIGFLGVQGNYSYANFVAAMALEQLHIDESLNHWLPSVGIPSLAEENRRKVRQSAGAWLAAGPAASAMICQNDQFALGLVDAMGDRGLTPGRDLSVVGFDNIEERRNPPAAHPMLTTLHNPLERRGRRMAELLLNQILHGQNQIIHERVPVRLIVRSSTGPCSSGKTICKEETC